MNVEVIQGKHRIVRAHGEIDISNTDLLQTPLNEAVRDCPQGFVVDLSDVRYLDSGGLQTLLTAYRRTLDAGGKMAVVIAHPIVKDIFRIISADRFPNFFVCDSIESAEKVMAEGSEEKP